MMAVPAAPKRSTAILVAIGLIASVIGLVAPQMLPADKASPPTSPSAPGAPGTAHDAKDLSYVPPTWPEPPSVQSLMLRLGFGTMFVLVLSVAAIWYGKRYLAAYAGGLGNGELKLVETLVLGNRCRLHLVRLGARQILVGADGAGIKTVTPLDDFAEVLAADVQPPAPPMQAAA
jgi:flagellar biogenesis protein FliO